MYPNLRNEEIIVNNNQPFGNPIIAPPINSEVIVDDNRFGNEEIIVDNNRDYCKSANGCRCVELLQEITLQTLVLETIFNYMINIFDQIHRSEIWMSNYDKKIIF